MALYDGNQLPENPTSTFQIAVSVVYALQVCFFLSMGAFAVLSAQESIDTELPAHVFMQRLVAKRNAVLRGLLAFVPGTYSLVHLYTSSLHNGNLYSASNIVFVAVFGFATRYLGWAFEQLVEDMRHMDTTKAVHECLYMLSRCCAKLVRGRRSPAIDEDDVEFLDSRSPIHEVACGDAKAAAFLAWRSPRVLFNNFLAIAALEDACVWSQLLLWLRHLCNTPLNGMIRGTSSYAYWLFNANNAHRNFTGSVIINQGVAEKLSIASCTAPEIHWTAQRYLQVFSKHVQDRLLELQPQLERLTAVCSAGKVKVKLTEAAQLLCRINFGQMGLAMAVERYMVRDTPACAAPCLPAEEVVPLIHQNFKKLFATEGAERTFLQAMKGHCATFYCTLWLAYMHLVMIGIDLLRMHNNKPVFSDSKHEEGALNILMGEPLTDAECSALPNGTVTEASVTTRGHARAIDSVARKVTVPAELQYPELHNLSNDDLHSLAAVMATLLLVDIMREDRHFSSWYVAELRRNDEIGLEQHSDVLEDKQGSSYTCPREQLVQQHASLPTIVQGVQCLSPTNWVQSLREPLGRAAIFIAFLAATIATIACSNGVLLVAIAGFLQAWAAWGLLMSVGELAVDCSAHPRNLWRRIYDFVGLNAPWGICQLLWVAVRIICTPMVAAGQWMWCLIRCKVHTVQELAPDDHGIPVSVTVVDGSGKVAPRKQTSQDASTRTRLIATSLSAGAVAQQCARATPGNMEEDIKKLSTKAVDTAVWLDELMEYEGVAAAAPVTAAAAPAALAAAAQDSPHFHVAGGHHAAYFELELRQYNQKLHKLFGSLGTFHHIKLGDCFPPRIRPFFSSRIKLVDIGIPTIHMLLMAFFVVGVVLSVVKEPYYATPAGMCLGRCHNRTDCWANVTLGLPRFDTNPMCPGEGERATLPADTECPRVIKRLHVEEITPTHDASGTAAATMRLVDVRTGRPAKEGMHVFARWAPSAAASDTDASTPVANSTLATAITDILGTANFTAPSSEGGCAWNLSIDSAATTDFKMDDTSPLTIDLNQCAPGSPSPPPGGPSATPPATGGPAPLAPGRQRAALAAGAHP